MARFSAIVLVGSVIRLGVGIISRSHACICHICVSHVSVSHISVTVVCVSVVSVGVVSVTVVSVVDVGMGRNVVLTR